MIVLVTCKNKDPLKLKALLEWSQHLSHYKSMVFVVFFRRSREANSAVRAWTWRNFGLIQAFIVVLITCKNEEDPIKNGTTLNTKFLYEIYQTSLWIFSGVV